MTVDPAPSRGCAGPETTPPPERAGSYIHPCLTPNTCDRYMDERTWRIAPIAPLAMMSLAAANTGRYASV